MMPNLGASVAKGDIREGGNHETVQRGKALQFAEVSACCREKQLKRRENV